jgi:hypothetical protein
LSQASNTRSAEAINPWVTRTTTPGSACIGTIRSASHLDSPGVPLCGGHSSLFDETARRISGLSCGASGVLGKSGAAGWSALRKLGLRDTSGTAEGKQAARCGGGDLPADRGRTGALCSGSVALGLPYELEHCIYRDGSGELRARAKCRQGAGRMRKLGCWGPLCATVW